MREWLPREHALWGWLCVPLTATALAVPTPVVFAAILACFAGFFSWNAVSRWQRGSAKAALPALLAAVVASVAVAPAVALAPHAQAMATLFAAAELVAIAIAVGTRGHLRQDPTSEAIVIASLCGFAWAVGAAAGGEPVRLAVILLVALAWEWLGLWWINRNLAPLLPGRTAWHAGPWAVASAIGVTGVAAWSADAALLGVLPGAYVARIATAGRVRGPRDARRLGLGELAWGLGIVAFATRVL